MSYEQLDYTEYYLDLLDRLYRACTQPEFYQDYWLSDVHDSLMVEVQEALGDDLGDPRDD